MPLTSQGVSLAVPDPDNTRNAIINDLIGNRLDNNDTSTLAGRLFDLWEEKHAAQLVYPPLADGIIITAHNDPWTPGSFIEIAPANAITIGFHIHHICICTASDNGEYEIILYRGTTMIGQVTFTRTDKKDDVEGLDIFTVHCEANSQIQAKLASGNTGQDTVRLKFWYHPHG